MHALPILRCVLMNYIVDRYEGASLMPHDRMTRKWKPIEMESK